MVLSIRLLFLEVKCHDLAKQLSYYLYFFFSFRLTTYKEYRKVSCHKCYTNHSHMMSHDESHDGCVGK